MGWCLRFQRLKIELQSHIFYAEVRGREGFFCCIEPQELGERKWEVWVPNNSSQLAFLITKLKKDNKNYHLCVGEHKDMFGTQYWTIIDTIKQ